MRYRVVDILLRDTIVPKKWIRLNDNLIDSAYALILFVYDTSPSLKLNSIKSILVLISTSLVCHYAQF